MSVFGYISRSLTGIQKRSAETVADFYNLVRGSSTSVSSANGLGISTVYSCIDTISKTFATLPSEILRVEADGDKVPNTRHPLNKQLTKTPNPDTTIYTAKRNLAVDFLAWGNGYLLKLRDKKFRVVGFVNIKPWDMMPFRDGQNNLYYQCYDIEHKGTYPAADVIHLKDIGWHSNPDLGMSKIDLHATTIGKEKAAAAFINKFYTNGMFLGGVIEYPVEVKKDQINVDDLRRNFKEHYGGIDKGASVAIITGGGTLKQFKSEMPLSNAQYVESAKMNRQEICSIFSVPPSKIGFTEGTPYNSLESLNVDYWQNCILPLVTMYEQEVALKCFSEDNVILDHNFDSVLRADTAAMAEYFTKLFNIGALSENEIRTKIGKNKIKDGDRYFIQGNNMVPIDKIDSFLLKKNGDNSTK